MREIKFRVWNPELKEMYILSKKEYLGGTGIYDDLVGHEKGIWMQFTGLKDKNGTDIYEGDILKNNYGDLWVVIWYGIGFKLALFGDSKRIYSANEYYFSSCEVVGNIFQDGDLLDSEISKVDRD